ncbi:MAG: glycosyltransferase family protein [Minisyncoccota bacterium]
MKIVLATPLYPPDIEPVALYNKELAKRLTAKKHKVTIATYSKHPEQIDGVRIITTDKQNFSFARITHYTIKLWKELRGSDVMYVQNGASVELPTLLITSIIKKPFVFFETDINARKRAGVNFFLKILRYAILHRACAIITNIPSPKPEILPFDAYPEENFLKYETEWNIHLETLSKITL